MIAINDTCGLDLTCDHWLRPAGAAGGDFVVVHRTAANLRVFMGDVTGHGEEAARCVALVRPMIEREMRQNVTVATLWKWSQAVRRVMEDRFVAFTFIEIDIDSGVATFATAGNPSMLLVRDGSLCVERFDADGMPLGLVDDDEWVAPTLRTFELGCGDEVVCFTDGVTDMIDRRGEVDAVQSLLGRESWDGGRSLATSLGAGVLERACSARERDDATVVWVGEARRRAA